MEIECTRRQDVRAVLLTQAASPPAQHLPLFDLEFLWVAAELREGHSSPRAGAEEKQIAVSLHLLASAARAAPHGLCVILEDSHLLDSDSWDLVTRFSSMLESKMVQDAVPLLILLPMRTGVDRNNMRPEEQVQIMSLASQPKSGSWLELEPLAPVRPRPTPRLLRPALVARPPRLRWTPLSARPPRAQHETIELVRLVAEVDEVEAELMEVRSPPSRASACLQRKPAPRASPAEEGGRGGLSAARRT
jgi:hypothetical protein